MTKKLWSIFTDDMNTCFYTFRSDNIERHHIFGGADRTRSEQFGFVVPLHRSVHPNGAYRTDPNWLELDHWLKRKCQEYYIEVARIGTREDFYNEFGRFYDDRCNERVWIDKEFEWELKT